MSVAIYEELTAGRSRFLRVDELCRLASGKGALPPLAAMEEEARRPLKEKQGLERKQGEFLADILADPLCGTHLCHAMLLPHPDSQSKLKEFQAKGEIDLGGAHLVGVCLVFRVEIGRGHERVQDRGLQVIRIAFRNLAQSFLESLHAGTVVDRPVVAHECRDGFDVVLLALALDRTRLRPQGVNGDARRDRLIGAMKRNIYRQGIPSGTSATVANKVGFLWNLLHDASIVYSPKGTYVLVILTDGSSWGNIAQLTRELEKLR